MNTLSKVYSKLNKKTELATHKVDLGIVDDLKKLSNQASKLEKELRENSKEGFEIRKQEKEIEKSKTSLRKILSNEIKKGDSIYKKLDSLIQKAFKTSKELGVNPKEIKGFSEANDRLQTINNAVDLATDSLESIK